MSIWDKFEELEYAGNFSDACDLAVASADKAEPAEAAALLARASEQALFSEGSKPALELAKRAIEKGDESADPNAQASALLAKVRVHLREHTDTALDDADATLALMPSSSLLRPELCAIRGKLESLGLARRGQPGPALRGFAEAYEQAAGFPQLRGRILLTWALQLRNWTLFAEAQRKATRSLEIRVQLGDHYSVAMCYGVLAFIYQRQGLYEQERDALVADIRLCEKLTTTDLASLEGRLAGALVGLGKYTGASQAAHDSLAHEDKRLGISGTRTLEECTRVHAFAMREQARVALAQGQLDQSVDLSRQGAKIFAHLSDRYGQALCRLTEAEAALVQLEEGDANAEPTIQAALACAEPIFTSLGAVPEATELALLQIAFDNHQGAGSGADRIRVQILPALRDAGLGDSAIYGRARDTLGRLSAAALADASATHAASLRGLATTIAECKAQPATVVAVHPGEQSSARNIVRLGTDGGALTTWPDSSAALLVFLGDRHEERAQTFIDALDNMPYALAKGEIELEHMWPAPPRPRGAPVEAALRALGSAP